MAQKSKTATVSQITGITVPILVSDNTWVEALPQCRTIAMEAALAAAGTEAGPEPLEISILLAGDEEVRGLNRDYRKIDEATNVLAFASGAPSSPAPEVSRLLGDVVLALGTVRREAEESGLAVADHLSHLVVHGVLHLLGYDHQTATEARDMERAETRILAGLGIADPYVGDESGGVDPQRER